MSNGNPADEIAEILSTPLEELLVALGLGIGRSQAELDRNSIEIQRQILEDPLLSQYGLEATWYQIPATELELKVAITMQQSSSSQSPGGPAPGIMGKAKRLLVQPVNARYTNQFSFDIQAASTVKLSVVAVPPPGGATTARPALSEEQAVERAQAGLFLDTEGRPEPRLTVNFNPGARAWYVLQTSEAGEAAQLRALVKVDDETGSILHRSGGPEG